MALKGPVVCTENPELEQAGNSAIWNSVLIIGLTLIGTGPIWDCEMLLGWFWLESELFCVICKFEILLGWCWLESDFEGVASCTDVP